MSVPGGYGQPPSSLMEYYASVEQGSNRRFDVQIAQQAKQAKAQLDNAYRIAKLQASTQAEQTAVDRWYKQQQVALAQKTFDESVRQFDKTYGLQEADTTGWFGAKPTLAREQQEFQQGVTRGQLTGEYGGAPTLEARELERKYGLAAGELTGIFNGTATAAERERIARLGITQGELMGVYNGQQTLAAQEMARRFGLDERKFGLDERRFGLDERRFGLDERELERKYGLVEGEMLGSYNGQDTLEARELARRFGLDQQKFGLTAAQTAAEMRARPDMLFQYQQFAREMAGQQPQTGAGPQGQTIAGQLGELGMGYLASAAGGGAAPGAPPAAGSPQTTGPAGVPLSEQEQARHVQLVARARQLAAAGEPVPAAEAAELSAYQARMGTAVPGQGPGGGQPLSPQEQARWQQLMARHQQLGAAGGPGLQGADLDEARRFQARGATYAGPGGASAGGAIPGGTTGYQAPGVDPNAAGPTAGLMEWKPGGMGGATGSPWFQPYQSWQSQQQGGPSADMAYLSAAHPQSADPTLAAIGKQYQRGFQALGAQSLETMDKNELGFLKSGGTFQGYDFDRELRKYAGSRLGQ